MSDSSDSGFRRQIDLLKGMTGRRIEWPQLARLMIEQEFQRIRDCGRPYTGAEVFINRDARALQHADNPNQGREEVLVYQLYRSGTLTVGERPIWLICCQVPNQADEGKRCADLLGLREDGSLVVFECKVAGNGSDSPLFALLEGLDYLAHLLVAKNVARLSEGFKCWKSKCAQSRVPPPFQGVDINSEATHAVFVAAPQIYYENHWRDSEKVPQQWEYLSNRCWPDRSALAVELDFIVTDYQSKDCQFLRVPVASGGR